jgi:tRNA(His) 5'-end guanylyltransferase
VACDDDVDDVLAEDRQETSGVQATTRCSPARMIVRAAGRYTVRARLVYDLNRYNDRAFQDDQFEMAQETLEFTIPTSQ